METPPVHVLLEIQGGEVVEANAEISTPTVTESSAGDDSDEGSPAPAPESAPPPSPPPGAPIKVRTAGGREVIVLEKTQQGWFSVELDGKAAQDAHSPGLDRRLLARGAQASHRQIPREARAPRLDEAASTPSTRSTRRR